MSLDLAGNGPAKGESRQGGVGDIPANRVRIPVPACILAHAHSAAQRDRHGGDPDLCRLGCCWQVIKSSKLVMWIAQQSYRGKGKIHLEATRGGCCCRARQLGWFFKWFRGGISFFQVMSCQEGCKARLKNTHIVIFWLKIMSCLCLRQPDVKEEERERVR